MFGLNGRMLKLIPLALLCLAAAPKVVAGGMVAAPYDWVLELDTKVLSRQFNYSGSTLKKVEKVSVKYYPSKDDSQKTQYEYLWFNEGKALGMEKQRKFDLPQGEGVAIKVKHDNASPTVEEKKATANAILRIAMDSLLNKNPVNMVEVPAGSFTDIANELQNLGMMEQPDDNNDFGAGFSPNITIYLYSDPSGQKITLYR